MPRLLSLLAFLPLLQADNGAGDGAAPDAGGAASDPEAGFDRGFDDDLSIAAFDDPPDEGDADDDDDVEGFGFDDLMGLEDADGDEVQTDDDATPQADAKKDEAQTDESAPAELPAALKAAILAAIPDAVVDSVEAHVERLVAVDTAAREMRTLQNDIDGVFQKAPGIEAVVTTLMEADKKGEPLDVLEAIGRAFPEVEILDDYDPRDLASSAKRAETKGRLAAHRETQAKQAAEREAYLKEYVQLADAEFKTFAETHFGEDAGKRQAFLRKVEVFHNGDPVTGRLMRPAEKFELLRKGYSYDADIAAAVERGRVEGRKEKGPRRPGAVLPQLSSGRGIRASGGSSGGQQRGFNHDAF